MILLGIQKITGPNINQYYSLVFFIGTAVFISTSAIILYCGTRELKRLKDINALFTRYNYVYEKMPAHAKKRGIVLNQYGVNVDAEEEFASFVNKYYLICDLPYEERDPRKWNKKNIGKYFSR